jgi:hypothetical protein
MSLATDRKRLGANPTGQDVAFGQDGDVSSRLHKQPDADAIPNRKALTETVALYQ